MSITTPVDFQTSGILEATDTLLAVPAACTVNAECGAAPAHCVDNKCYDGHYFSNVPFAFTYAGTNAYGLRVLIDDKVYAVVTPVPASPYTVSIPNGQHRVAFTVTNEFGTPYNGCEDARDSVLLRITRPCVFTSDCDDGNPCSSANCNASKKCQYGAESGVPGCCNSDYDCDYFEVCYDQDSLPATPDTCTECIPGQAGNCPEQKCKEAVCKADFTCGFNEVSTCCARDSDCAGYPCETCDIDDLTGEGLCVLSQFALDLAKADPPQTCCKAKTDQNADGQITQDDHDLICEALDNDPCTIEACIGNVCRKGATYFGCCDADADCADRSKLNVCNEQGGHASCAKDAGDPTGACDYTANDEHAGCCFSNTDCVRALIQNKVVDDASTCTTDAQCSADYPTCLEGKCHKKYPQFKGVCDKENPIDVGLDEWFECDYQPNPDFCQVPSSVSAIVITELSIDPLNTASPAVPDSGREWIELMNPGATPVDLGGWYLNDDSVNVGDLSASNIIGWESNNVSCTADAGCLAADARYPTCQATKCWGLQQKIVNPGKSFVVCRDVAAKNAGVPCSYVMSATAAWGLGNSGDTVALFGPDPDGTLGGGAAEPDLIDTVTYSAAKVVTGTTLALAHPYVDNGTDLHWVGAATNVRVKYDASNQGTPLKVNNDVFEKALIDDGSVATFIDLCDDAKDCTLGLCNLNAANYCGQVRLSGCCDPTTATNGTGCTADAQCTTAPYTVCDLSLGKCVSATALAQQCSDGNACTVDSCGSSTLTCNNGTADPACCSKDSECADYYPENLDLDVDLVPPVGTVNDLDETAIKASFDEIVNKKCVGHKCRYRKNPAALGGCIASTYALAAFACDDKNSCTKNVCTCSTGAEGDCRNENAADGYYKCDYATPTTAGDDCCYDAADCADDDLIVAKPTCAKDSDCGAAPARCSIDGKCYDGVDNDPSTAESCSNYECTTKAKDGWCDDNGDCNKGTICQVGTCTLATNTCVYAANPAKAGCCASNVDCINAEIADKGQNLAYTIDVCCDSTTNAIGTNTQLDALCDGVDGAPTADLPLCVHATGQNFCDTSADCTADVGKRCLTAYCVAHRCRFGLPELDGNLGTTPAKEECCDPTRPPVGGVNPDCQDNDPCTVDACVTVAGQPTFGYCTHVADAAKPACCNKTEDCTASTTDCTQTACQFDATAGYKKCKDFDLLALGLCCAANADCDDANACTLDVCQDENCRHTKPVEECCTKVTECPPTGDICSTKSCPLAGDTGACTLSAVAGCTAPLPYQQDFEFAHEFYNDAFTDEALVGWTAQGQATAAWAPSDALGQNHSKHLRFSPADVVAADTGACVALPKLNTTGQSAAVVAFYHALDVAATQGAVTLTVQARQKTSSSWETIWTNNAALDVAEVDVYAPVAAKYLGSVETGVRFCLTSTTVVAGTYWTLDDVKVVRGSLPTLVTNITDKVVAKGADLLINDVDAYDQDFDTVSYSLVGAPAFVTLTDFHTASVLAVTHTYIDVQVTDAECEGVGGDNVYPITLKISDGFLNVYETFNLTVTGCSGL